MEYVLLFIGLNLSTQFFFGETFLSPDAIIPFYLCIGIGAAAASLRQARIEWKIFRSFSRTVFGAWHQS